MSRAAALKAVPEHPQATSIILAVDRDADAAEHYAASLRAFGHRVDVLFSYPAAEVELARGRHSIAIVCLDLDPAEAPEWLSRFHSAAPGADLIVITADPARELEIASRSRKISYYMTKPLEISELCSVVSHLDLRRMPASTSPAPPPGMG